MADPIRHDVFKFVALRPPTLADTSEPQGQPIRDERSLDGTIVGRAILQLHGEPTHAALLPVLKSAVAAAGMDSSIPRRGPASELRPVVEVIRRHLRAFDAATIPDQVKDALGQTIATYVRGPWAAAKAELWDRLETFYLLNRETPANVEDVVDGIRAGRVLELIASGTTFRNVEELRRTFSATLILPDAMSRVAPATPPRTSRQEEIDKRNLERRKRYEATWTRAVELHAALEEVRKSPIEMVTTEERGAAPPKGEPGREAAILARAPSTGIRSVGSMTAKLSASVARGLPSMARSVIDSACRADTSLSSKPVAIAALQKELSQVTKEILSSRDPMMFEAMPVTAMTLPGMLVFRDIYSLAPALPPTILPFPVPFPWVTRPVIRPLGIGDLKVVKQTLQRYVAGEVAHIENVLKGESKERKHRLLDRTEETLTVETETTEETERDTQTTDRFELKKETERTIQSDMSVSAGVTVSASYGPVELGAYANFAYNQSSSDTTRNSSNFARDVVDRSLTKIQKRSFEQRISKKLHEVEEINTHGLTNTAGAGHIIGIYRWVDKHYKAQVYNYGKRMMFEFIVPEPSAYYIYSQVNDPAKAIDIPAPVSLGTLTHSDIHDWNYDTYIRNYNVQGCTPPPPEWKVVATAIDQFGLEDDKAFSKSTKELAVPDGYVARHYGARWYYFHGDRGYIAFLIGTTDTTTNILSGEDSVVPVGIQGFDLRSYAVTIEVFCERTARHYEDWQIKTFEKIKAAYETAKAMYEDKIKAAEVSRGIVIQGRNPGFNRLIERAEMKKHCLSLLTGEDYSQFNSVSGNPPMMSLLDAVNEGKFIQFFEQAFEWEQMTYLFYPYFWGRKSQWVDRINMNDVDPLFNQFLQAGAARIIIPVHPAYKEAILHYVETGAIWNGGEPPHLNDPLFVSIVEELKAATDDLDGATPEGDPWDVVIPTTLVYLQQDATLPDYTA